MNIAASGYPDPTYTVIAQHLRTLRRLLQKWPVHQLDHLKEAFFGIRAKIQAHKEPWRIVAGPIAAALAYAKDLGWQAQSLTVWQANGVEHDLLNPKDFHRLLFALKEQLSEHRWRKISRHQFCAGLEAGVDWSCSQKLLRKLPTEQANCLKALQQGAIQSSTAGKKAWCTLCSSEATLEHVLWTCKCWDDYDVPAHIQDLRTRWPLPSLWCHGLVPKLMPPAQPVPTRLTGAWASSETINDPEVRYATDGSPGGHPDPRCWALRWAAIAFKVRGDDIDIVATAVGSVECEQTVFRAEATAVEFVALHTVGTHREHESRQ